MDLLKLSDVAKMIMVPVSTVSYWAKAQKIPAFKLGKHWRFNRAAIEAWLVDKQQASAPKTGN